MADDDKREDDEEEDEDTVECPTFEKNPDCEGRFTPPEKLKGKKNLLCRSCHKRRLERKEAGEDPRKEPKMAKKKEGKAAVVEASPKKDSIVKNAVQVVVPRLIRRLSGMAVEAIPQNFISAARRSPMGGEWISPTIGVATFGIEQFAPMSEGAKAVIRDALADASVSFERRLTNGGPVTPEEAVEYKAAAAKAKDEAKEAADFKFKVVVEQQPSGSWVVGREFHSPVCPALPEPRETKWDKGGTLKVAGIKHRDLTHHQCTALNLTPCATCKPLIDEQVEKSKKAEKKAEEAKVEGDKKRRKSAAELLGTDAGKFILDQLNAFYGGDPAMREQQLAFILENLDEDELPLLSRKDITTRAEFELALAAIRNRREASTAEAMIGKAADGINRIAAATGLTAAADRVDQGLGAVLNRLRGTHIR